MTMLSFNVCALLAMVGIESYVSIMVTETTYNASFAVGSPGYILSPDYPHLYSKNWFSWWKLQTTNTDEHVVVEILELHLFPDIVCTYDRITVYDGFNSSDAKLGIFCESDKTIRLMSSGNGMYIEFTVERYWDGISTSFKIAYSGLKETRPCGEHLMANSTFKTIYSPGYPYSYFPNQECLWTIYAEDTNATILVEIEKMEIQHSDGCSKDLLAVFADNITRFDLNSSVLLGKMCGTADTVITTHSPRNIISLYFRSDEDLVAKGFKIIYKTVPVSSCSRILHAGRFPLYLTSPGYPDPPPFNMTCSWDIYSALTKRVQVKLQSLKPYDDNGNDCNYAYFLNFANSTAFQSPYYCGESSSYQRYYTSLHNYISIQMRLTDWYPVTAFRIMYQEISSSETVTQPPHGWPSYLYCNDTHLTATSTPQYLASPGYPQRYYSYLTCHWYITSRPGTMIRAEVLTSDIDGATKCHFGWVKAFDGFSVSARVIEQWCGARTPVFQTTANRLLLEFRTEVAGRHKGFHLKYYTTSTPYTCNRNLTVTATEKYIYSPGYPIEYPNHVDCTWYVYTTWPGLKIQVKDADLYSSSDWQCSEDYVKIYEGVSSDAPTKATFCTIEHQTYIISASRIRIRFHSDKDMSKTGFKISIRGGIFSECGDLGLEASTITPIYMTSPHYPLPYPNNVDCTWRISTLSDSMVVHLEVFSSNIQYTDGCVSDYVQIFDGSDFTSPSLGKFCGSDTPTFHSNGMYMYIHFRTDSSIIDKGFKMGYSWKGGDYDNVIKAGAIAGGICGAVLFFCLAIASCKLYQARTRRRRRLREARRATTLTLTVTRDEPVSSSDSVPPGYSLPGFHLPPSYDDVMKNGPERYKITFSPNINVVEVDQEQRDNDHAEEERESYNTHL